MSKEKTLEKPGPNNTLPLGMEFRETISADKPGRHAEGFTETKSGPDVEGFSAGPDGNTIAEKGFSAGPDGVNPVQPPLSKGFGPESDW